ncbi:MAG: hypothetical protein GEV07_12720 [Streptosporangiales bacterium]|nr:hypothetical protein [Streptosporangiales bacterium]
MASLMLVGLLIVGAVFVVLSDDGGGEVAQSPTPQATTTTQPTQMPSESSTETDDCDLKDKRQKLPESAPDDINWTLWKGMALPASESAGPLEVDDENGVTRCYARTPMGAVMATMNIGFRTWLAAPDTSVVDKQYAEGAFKDEVRAMVAGEGSVRSPAQIAGFRILAYSKSDAIVEVAVGDSRSGYAKGQATLTWADGSWKAVATAEHVSDGGGWQGINSIDGFIELRGVD